MDEQIPFEIGYEAAKADLVNCISAIADKYRMPSSLMIIVLDSTVNEIKTATYSQIMQQTSNVEHYVPTEESADEQTES